jgi:hypothetical protein
VSFVSGVFDVSRNLRFGKVGVVPAVNLGLTTLNGHSATEFGADSLNLVLESDRQSHVWIEPSVAFRVDGTLWDRTYLSGFARLGALTFLTHDTAVVRAGLAGAPAGADSMRVVSDLDRFHVMAEGGVELSQSDKFSLSLSYSVDGSRVRDSGQGTLRVVIPIR